MEMRRWQAGARSAGLDLGKKRGTAVPRLGEAEKVNEQCPCNFPLFMGKARASSLPFTVG